MKSIMQAFFVILVSIFVVFSASAVENRNLETTPDINGWGFDVGFSSKPYHEYSTRISVLTPHVFSLFGDTDWRITGDFIGNKLLDSALDEDEYVELAVSLESNTSLYKDVIYSYTKWGVGAVMFDDAAYDGTIINVPLSFGVQLITRNEKNLVMSYFLEYRFSLLNTFDEDDSLSPVLEDNRVFAGMTSFGLRLIF